jgi:hypothetical protein
VICGKGISQTLAWQTSTHTVWILLSKDQQVHAPAPEESAETRGEDFPQRSPVFRALVLEFLQLDQRGGQRLGYAPERFNAPLRRRCLNFLLLTRKRGDGKRHTKGKGGFIE